VPLLPLLTGAARPHGVFAQGVAEAALVGSLRDFVL